MQPLELAVFVSMKKEALSRVNSKGALLPITEHTMESSFGHSWPEFDFWLKGNGQAILKRLILTLMKLSLEDI